MQYRNLGNTGFSVSVLGLGTVKFGRNTGVKYPQGFELPSDSQMDHLLALAQDLGINLIDTAPAYGISEQRLGRSKAFKRQDWVLVSKAGENYQAGQSNYAFDRHSIIASVEKSLRDLQTDYLDVLLVHSDGRDEAIIQEDEVFDTMAYLKQQGKIRAMGFSGKTVSGAQLALSQAEVLMLMYHPQDQSHAEVLQRAEAQNCGILIKKAFNSGHLDQFALKDPVKAVLQFILKQACVSSIVTGTINPDHLKSNALAISC